MFRYMVSCNFKDIINRKRQLIPFNTLFLNRTYSVTTNNTSNKRNPYIKYLVLILGGGITISVASQAYIWIVQVPKCPNFNPNQNIAIQNILASTSLVRAIDKKCSGNELMKKIGAATSVNYKLVSSKLNNINSSIQIRLNDNPIAERNLFDTNYTIEYIETLADLIIKLDEIHRTRLLSNLIGYYIFVCPECHSSITRRMISCTSYLNTVGLEKYTVDLSEVNEQENQS